MNCYVRWRLFVKFIILLILLFLIISCAESTKILISKNFDKQKSKIAVMQFVGLGLKGEQDPYISDKFAFALARRGFTVVERQRVESIFSELRLKGSDALSKSDYSKIGQLAGVDIICFGSVYYQSSARGAIWPYTITVRFIDVKSGEAVFMAECQNEVDWDGSSCVNELSNKLVKSGQ